MRSAGIIVLSTILLISFWIACEPDEMIAAEDQIRFDESKVLPLYEKKTGFTPGPKHGDALVGSLKYGTDFTHFAYVNPSAPVGGTLTLSSPLKFDSFNPFIIKGTAAPGLGLVFENLMTASFDEPASQYGLLAESIEYPEDKSRITFTLNPNAKWHDGQPVTAEDVIYSFEIQKTKGLPSFAQYYADVARLEKTGPRSVTFYPKPKSNPELPHILGQISILPKHFFEKNPFDAPLRTPPIGSGPYKVKEYSIGQTIVYERNPDYWGWTLPANRGMYNFQNIKYIVYLDDEARFLAFKAGEYSFREENTAARWATEYTGPQFESGEVAREKIRDDSPKGIQSLLFNTRKEMFQDRRVREAIVYFQNFEWMNKVFFYNTYSRSRSFFENSVFASYLGGLPSAGERKYLDPLKDQIPPEVFTQVYKPPQTDGSDNMRENQKKALEIFKSAGWEIKEEKLINVNTGKQLTFEILLADSRMERIMAPFVENLKKAGIDASYRRIDYSQWVERILRFDFDMTSLTLGQSFSPGNEQRNYWGSKAADTENSSNFAGIKNPAVDSLIESIIAANNFEELKSATRALDRVLLWNFFVIPQWYINYHRIAFKKNLRRPRTDTPLFVSAYESVAATTWWSEEK